MHQTSKNSMKYSKTFIVQNTLYNPLTEREYFFGEINYKDKFKFSF